MSLLKQAQTNAANLRALCREAFAIGLDSLTAIANGERHAQAGDVIRANDVLAKYGMGEAKTFINAELLQAAGQVAGQFLVPGHVVLDSDFADFCAALSNALSALA